jgi:ABC-type amino acid transport system permease subunit
VILNLIFGLPDQRPGGLVLTLIVALGSGVSAALLGIVYASACVRLPRTSLALQAALAILRGVPLLLLIFVLGQTTRLTLPAAGFLALVLYSLSHIGETFRSFLAQYPAPMTDQARLLGIGPMREWLTFRLPWTFRRSLDALATHWISLLKDTGALVVLGIGELTTVTKVLSERGSLAEWRTVVLTAGLLYLVTAIVLIRALAALRARYALKDVMSS